MKLNIRRLDESAVLPRYSHGPDEDAGMDLCSVERVLLEPGTPRAVRTGLALELPPASRARCDRAAASA